MTISVDSTGPSAILVLSTPQASIPAPTRLLSCAPSASPHGRSRAPSRPTNSVRSPVQPDCLPFISMNETVSPNSSFHGFCANMAPVSGSISVAIKVRPCRCDEEQPLDVRSHGKLANPARLVGDREPRDLDRVIVRNELHALQRDAVRGVLKAAVPLAMRSRVARTLLPDR